MAAIPVVIKGTIIDASASAVNKDITIVGELGFAGLEIGGGPIIPDQPPAQPGLPTFPIWGPPGIELPPGAGYPPVAGHPLPPVPDQPPVTEPPDPIIGWEAKVFWTEQTGWGVAIVPKEGTPVPTPSRRDK